MSDHFISYAKEDRERARVLAKALEELGWSVWWDRIIPIGKPFDVVIHEELDAAKCVIVLWSSNSVDSEWVKEEARYALAQEKFFPALIDAVPVPFGFGSYQSADLVDWDGKTTTGNFPLLVENMGRVLGTPPKQVVHENRRAEADAGSEPEAEEKSRHEEREATSKAEAEAKRMAAEWERQQRSEEEKKRKAEPAHLRAEAQEPRTAEEAKRKPEVKAFPVKPLTALLRRNRVAVWAVVLVLVLGTVLTVWWARRSEEPAAAEPVESDQKTRETRVVPPPEVEGELETIARLVIRSNVAGDEVYLDGAAQGPTPKELDLPPGRYVVEAKKAGCEDAVQVVDLGAGDAPTLLLELSCPPPGSRLGQGVGERSPAPAESTVVMEEEIPWGDARRTESAPSRAEDEALNRRILIQGGEFLMGSPNGVGRDNERPQHRVTVSSFYLQQHEVTIEEYRRFDRLIKNRTYEDWHGKPVPMERHPVMVSWNQATAYAAWLGGSLPTEAQWEYAARGSQGRTYPWGEAGPGCNRAHQSGCAPSRKTEPVCSKPKGSTPGTELCDLAGSLWDWCSDRYGEREYSERTQINPVGPKRGMRRVVRGGAFDIDSRFLRSAFRRGAYPHNDYGLGFRVAFEATGRVD